MSKSKETKKDAIVKGSEDHICNMVANIGRYAAEYFEEAMEEEIVYEDGLFLLALMAKLLKKKMPAEAIAMLALSFSLVDMEEVALMVSLVQDCPGDGPKVEFLENFLLRLQEEDEDSTIRFSFPEHLVN